MLIKPSNYDFIYFDWNRLFVFGFTNDDEQSFEVPSLRDMINSLSKPTVIIGESTFESYNLIERQSVHELALSQGHLWYGTPNRLTYRWRNRFGWNKTDENDARTIRIIAEYPDSLSSIREYKTEGEERAIDGQKQYVYNAIPYENISISEYIGKGSWARLRPITITSAEEDIVRRVERRNSQSLAMEFRRLDSKEKDARLLDFKRVILKILEIDPGKTMAATKRNFAVEFSLLNNSVVWAVVFAAQAASSRDEFETLLGAYAHGAKSMLRSQFYHWGWAGNGKGPMHAAEASLSEYRKQARKLGSLVSKNDLQI